MDWIKVAEEAQYIGTIEDYIENYQGNEAITNPEKESELFKRFSLTRPYRLDELDLAPKTDSCVIKSPRLITAEDRIMSTLSKIGTGGDLLLRINLRTVHAQITSIDFSDLDAKKYGFQFYKGSFCISPIALNCGSLYHAFGFNMQRKKLNPLDDLSANEVLGNPSADYPTYLSRKKGFSLLHSTDMGINSSIYGVILSIDCRKLREYRHIYTDPEGISYRAELGVSYFVRGGIPAIAIDQIRFTCLVDEHTAE
jgi:hypothetical protein